jgi:hypothetical protein
MRDRLKRWIVLRLPMRLFLAWVNLTERRIERTAAEHERIVRKMAANLGAGEPWVQAHLPNKPRVNDD